MLAPLNDFNNTEVAFTYKSDKELRRGQLLFRLMANPMLVNAGNRLLGFAIRTGLPVDWIVKPTIYRHFVGGQYLEECQPVVKKLSHYKVKSILDYSVEGNHDPVGIQKTLDETLRSIANAATDENIPFAVFKPTAFASAGLLENAVPGKPLEGALLNEYQLFNSRVETLCSEAARLNVPLMIDAEDSWYQHLVDETVENMMKKFNREKVIVFNTLQMYRHDRLEYLKACLKRAREGKYLAGIKFVRGAYIEKERARALSMGYPSPIQPDKESTDIAFNEALLFSLDNLDVVEVFCGSHNEDSNLLLAGEIDKRGLSRNNPSVWFAQLYGMSDHISFNLASAGFNVAKYIPYGPVKSVMPYLFRRAEENTSIAGQTSRELRLIGSEIIRRQKS